MQNGHYTTTFWLYPRQTFVGKQTEQSCRSISLTKLTYLALMRYCAKLMFAGEPVIVTCRSAEPSVALAILICAPDICLISFILLPCLPIMQPINWSGTKTEISATDTSKNHLTATCRIDQNVVTKVSRYQNKRFLLCCLE